MMVASVLIPAILLVGSLVWVAFYASGYSLFQKVVIVIIAMIVICVAESLLMDGLGRQEGDGVLDAAQAEVAAPAPSLRLT